MTQIIGETVSYLDKAKELCQSVLDDPKLNALFGDIAGLGPDDAIARQGQCDLSALTQAA